MTEKNNFRKNGLLRVRFETPEERTVIIRILEKQCGISVSEKLKRMTEIGKYDTRTFDIDLHDHSHRSNSFPQTNQGSCISSSFSLILSFILKECPQADHLFSPARVQDNRN